MRVAVFTDTYLPTVDGVVHSILNTRRALREMGHEVFIVAPGAKNQNTPHEDDVLFCRSRGLRRYPGYRLAILPTKAEMDFISRRDVDIVHSHGIGPMGIKGMWVSRELNLPMIQTFHTMIQDAIPHYTSLRHDSSFLLKLLSLYLRGFLHRCQAVVAPTRAILQELSGIAPLMKRTAVVPSGVDVETFRAGLNGDLIRRRHGIDEVPLILHVGRVSPEKDIEFLIRNLRKLASRLPGAKLMLVGTGPALPDYKMLVERLGLREDVIFAGFVPEEELRLYYAAADAMATASRFETQGLAALEAMACGKPVAAVNYRAFPEYIHDGVNGFLFEAGDTDGYCDAIVRAVNAGEDLRREARETAERFSLERCTKGLVSVYKDMLTKDG